MKKLVIALLTILTLGFAGCGQQSSTQQVSQQSNQQTSIKYTKSMYDKVETGMSYEQVKAILGDGEEQASTEAAGVKTKVYMWENSDGSNMNITFQNDKMIGKAQANLK